MNKAKSIDEVCGQKPGSFKRHLANQKKYWQMVNMGRSSRIRASKMHPVVGFLYLLPFRLAAFVIRRQLSLPLRSSGALFYCGFTIFPFTLTMVAMSYIIAGLGNPGSEYENTRHNAGRIILDALRKEFSKDEFVFDKKLNALVAEAKIGKEKVLLVAPETFMNNSGKSVAPIVKTKKNAKLKLTTADNLLVIYDDFQLPIGRMKISYNKSSGGHNGLESIIKSIKTEAFPRLRVGTAPSTAKGDAKIPHGETVIEKFILGKFKDDEFKELKKMAKKSIEGITVWIQEGREKATGVVNTQ